MWGRCVRSGLLLLLLLLARHPRSGDCCAAVGRAKREGEAGEEGDQVGGGAGREGGLLGLSGAANSDYMWP